MLIAISGLICSGKSVVLQTLKELGAEVIKTDDINRELLTTDSYITELKKLFPDCINSDNTVNKTKLRATIFNDSCEREKLNALAHPKIFERVMAIAKEIGGIVFVENPLIIASHTAQKFDKIWVVTARDDIRVDRLVQRDNVSYDDAKKTIAAQNSEKAALKIADVIIENNGSTKELVYKVVELYKIYVK